MVVLMDTSLLIRYMISTCIIIASIPVGDTVVGYLTDYTKKSEKSKYSSFLRSGILTLVVRLGMIVLAVIIGMRISKIPNLYFITSLGLTGIIASLALQNPIQDLFTGLLLVAFDKVRVGDFIRVDDNFEGTIREIQAFSTEIVNPLTNAVTDIPNTKLWSSNVSSVYRSQDYRMKMSLLISNRNDIKMVERVIRRILNENENVENVDISYTTSDSKGLRVDLAVKVNTTNYSVIKADLYRLLRIGLQERGIIMVDGAKPVSVGMSSEDVYPIVIQDAVVGSAMP